MNLSKGLDRYGRAVARRPWWSIAVVLVMLAVLGFLALRFMQAPTSEMTIPGIPAGVAADRASELFPKSMSGGSGTVVFKARQGQLSDYRANIEAVFTRVSRVDGVSGIVDMYDVPGLINKSGTIGYSTVQLTNPMGEVSSDTISAIRSEVEGLRSSGLQVEVGGGLVDHLPGKILGIGEIGGIVLALVILVMTLGTMVAAGLPILTALIGVGIGVAGLFAASYFFVMNSTTLVIAVMLGLAVGIDYSLFIINRYRLLLLDGYKRDDAIGRAMATAGNAVVFAALTVVIVLSSLAIVHIPFMTMMGLAGAGSVVAAGLVSLTLMPAFLSLVGLRIFRRRDREQIQKAEERGVRDSFTHPRRTFWYRWGEAVGRHPWWALAAAVVMTTVIALPMHDLRLGLPMDEYQPASSSERRAFDLISEGFGVGYNGLLLVVAEDLPQSANGQQPLSTVAARIAELDDVAAARPIQVGGDGSYGLVQVIPQSSPGSDATRNLVRELRDSGNLVSLTGTADAKLQVTGATATEIDVIAKMTDALPKYLAVVLTLSLLLLLVVFRSILIPLKAAFGFLLSVLAMFGGLVAVFQWGWFGVTDATGPIVSFVPMIVIGVMLGLAMDYEYFIISGMHEAYVRTRDARRAMVYGFGTTNKVVTAAGIIMVSVFAGFISNSDLNVRTVGFGLALGVLVDAFLVRLTITPALMSILGRSAWWVPKWLAAILPDISLEGETERERRK